MAFTRVAGPLVAVVSALLCVVGLTAVAPASAYASETTGVSVQPSEILLPHWQQPREVLGEREVWLQPVYWTGDERPEWDSVELTANGNDALKWFETASRGSFKMTVTRVLDPIYVSQRGCAPVQATWERIDRASRPAGVHVAVLSRETSCHFGGLGHVNGTSVLVTSVWQQPHIPPGALLHELGHNLGLSHVPSYEGAALSLSGAPGRVQSDVDEYGAITDLMGEAFSHTYTKTFGPANRAALGWGDGVVLVNTPGSHTVTLEPAEAPGPDAVVMDDPVTGVRYVLSYLDASADRFTGVHLAESQYQAPAPPYPGFASSALVREIPLDPTGEGGRGATKGTSWIAPSGAVSFTVTDMTEGSATVQVSVEQAGGLIDTKGPAWMTQQPTATWIPQFRQVAIHYFPAWDQSGVSSKVEIQVGRGKYVTVGKATNPSAGSKVYLSPNRQGQGKIIVRVRVTDMLGNVSVTRLPVSRHG